MPCLLLRNPYALAVLGATALGCEGGCSPSNSSPPNSAPPSGSVAVPHSPSQAPTASPPPPSPRGITVAVPPRELRVDPAHTGLMQVPPRTGAVLQLAGPPGGPLGFVFEPIAAEVVLSPTFVFARSNTVRQLGQPATVSIAGRQHSALAFTYGAAGAMSAQECLVALRSADDAALLLVTITTPASGPPSCETAVGSPPVARLLGTLFFGPASAACEPRPEEGSDCAPGGFCSVSTNEYLECRNGRWVLVREFRGPGD